MEDFSSFGEPTVEWLKWVEGHGLPAPAPIGQLSPEQLQRDVNEGREKASAEAMKAEGLHERICIKSIELPTRDGYSIPARVYSPHLKSPRPGFKNTELLPVYLFYHGGGFLYGTLSSEDAACSRIVDALSIIVLNICYRHTPQFSYPVQHNDAFDSFDWTLLNIASFGGDPQKIVVGGISAGANLAAAVVLRENLRSKAQNKRNENETKVTSIRGQVLIIPWLIISEDRFPYEFLISREKSSRVQCADAPVLPQSSIDFFLKNLRLNDLTSSMDKFLDVGIAIDEEVAGMPRTSFLIAGRDPLRDDGLFYAKKLHRNGIPTKIHVFPGLPHGFRRFTDLPSSRRWDELVVQLIKWALGDETSASSVDMQINIEVPLKNNISRETQEYPEVLSLAP